MLACGRSCFLKDGFRSHHLAKSIPMRSDFGVAHGEVKDQGWRIFKIW